MMLSREVHSLTGWPEDGDTEFIVRVGKLHTNVQAVMPQNTNL